MTVNPSETFNSPKYTLPSPGVTVIFNVVLSSVNSTTALAPFFSVKAALTRLTTAVLLSLSRASENCNAVLFVDIALAVAANLATTVGALVSTATVKVLLSVPPTASVAVTVIVAVALTPLSRVIFT